MGMVVLVLLLGMSLLETIGVLSVMPFLSILGNPDVIENNYILNLSYSFLYDKYEFGINEFLFVLGIISFVIIFLSSIFKIFTLFILNKFTEMRRFSIGRRLLSKYLSHPYSFFLNRHSSDLSKTILSEVDHLIVGVLRPTLNMIAHAFVLVAMIVLVFVINPGIAIMSFSVLGTVYISIFFLIRRKLSSVGEILVEENKKRFIAASDVFSVIKIIKLLGNEKQYLSSFGKSTKEFSLGLAINNTFNAAPKYLVETFAFGGVILIILYLIVSFGGVTNNGFGEVLPILGVFIFSAYRMQPALHAVFNGMTCLRFGNAAVTNLHKDLFEKTDTNECLVTNLHPVKFNKKIVFNGVSYSYPNSEKIGLDDINFTIPMGTTIGIVGTTGAGKTTLVDLLLGLLRPSSGNIEIDDLIVDNQIVRSWQSLLGYVPQEITLTDTSIYENIALGLEFDSINKEKVQECAKIAQIDNFIVSELRDGYHTKVGERGVRLSGGQRQRIGIARALYKDPQILVFDEATSALDTATEIAVMESIKNLPSQKTVVLIAHRLSTLQNCDQIILLDFGKIKKFGTYNEVINCVS